LNGIKGYIGENRIELKPNTKPFKHRPCYLNPRFKDKVKKDIDHILVDGLIFLVDEAEWINPIVIQIKKATKDIKGFYWLSDLELCMFS